MPGLPHQLITRTTLMMALGYLVLGAVIWVLTRGEAPAPIPEEEATPAVAAEADAFWNEAQFWTTDGIAHYQKRRLVPFGEYGPELPLVASLDLHAKYAALDEARYWHVQPWPKHERPQRWIIQLARKRILALKQAYL